MRFLPGGVSFQRRSSSFPQGGGAPRHFERPAQLDGISSEIGTFP